MLTRKRYREVPPRVDYELTERARDLMPILGELARWGYEWAWSSPRSSEQVDIGAIFRLAPGLVPPRNRGSVQCTVTDGRKGAPMTYTFSFGGDRVEVTEQSSEHPDAVISGDTAAWISAFMPEPDRDRSGLAFKGDRGLAETLLNGLALSIPSSRRAASVA